MNTVTKCLFGGALLGAGVSSSALAGEFQWLGGDAEAYAPGAPSVTSLINPSGFDVNIFTPFGSAGATGDSDGLSMFAESYSYAYTLGGFPKSAANVFGHFFVTEDMMVTIEWDFSGEVSSYGGFPPMESFLDINGFSASGESGSIQMQLFAFQFNSIDAQIRSAPSLFGPLDGNLSSVSIYETPAIVPLPPAAFAGLGMLLGLGVYKRIRQ
jgi:hypothetical protein